MTALAAICLAAATEKTAWIGGGGWALPAFPETNPTKEMLDAVVSDRPVLLSAADGHSLRQVRRGSRSRDP